MGWNDGALDHADVNGAKACSCGNREDRDHTLSLVVDDSGEKVVKTIMCEVCIETLRGEEAGA